jgi:hypothetical protein
MINTKIENFTKNKLKSYLRISSLVKMAILLILTLLWAIFMFKSITGYKKSTCLLDEGFETLKEGSKSNGLSFPGLMGTKYLLDKIGSSIENV